MKQAWEGWEICICFCR